MKKIILLSISLLLFVGIIGYLYSQNTQSPTENTSIKPEVSITKPPDITRSVAESDNDPVVKEVKTIFSKKYQKPYDSVLITIDKRTDNHTFGSVAYIEEDGGSIWFGAKVKNNWEVVYDGTQIIPCTIANDYEFPETFVPECQDVTTSKIIKR